MGRGGRYEVSFLAEECELLKSQMDSQTFKMKQAEVALHSVQRFWLLNYGLEHH